MKNQTLIMGLVSVVVATVVIYSYVYIGGKAWKKSQE